MSQPLLTPTHVLHVVEVGKQVSRPLLPRPTHFHLQKEADEGEVVGVMEAVAGVKGEIAKVVAGTEGEVVGVTVVVVGAEEGEVGHRILLAVVPANLGEKKVMSGQQLQVR